MIRKLVVLLEEMPSLFVLHILLLIQQLMIIKRECVEIVVIVRVLIVMLTCK